MYFPLSCPGWCLGVVVVVYLCLSSRARSTFARSSALIWSEMIICSTTWWAMPGKVFWSRSNNTAPGWQRRHGTLRSLQWGHTQMYTHTLFFSLSSLSLPLLLSYRGRWSCGAPAGCGRRVRPRGVCPSDPSPPPRPPQTWSNGPSPSSAFPGSYPLSAHWVPQTPIETTQTPSYPWLHMAHLLFFFSFLFKNWEKSWKSIGSFEWKNVKFNYIKVYEVKQNVFLFSLRKKLYFGLIDICALHCRRLN